MPHRPSDAPASRPASPPLVAVTATTSLVDGQQRVRLNTSYVEALTMAGVLPVVLPPLAPDQAAAALAPFDGLVLTGGEDIDPKHFGAETHPRCGRPHAERDAWELALTREARARALPTLAICRGIQVVNVALGGTLVQDIPSERPAAVGHDAEGDRGSRVHEVEVTPGSRLAGALAANAGERVRVNSFHHQAIDRVADGLRVTAVSPDGIAEGAEWTGDWWVLAVQWHPEELVRTSEAWDRGLFHAFAEAVRR